MAMNGNITELSLVDLIQLACMERYTARLSVNRNDESARIFFSNGEIVHAEVGDRRGPEALYEIVGWTDGEFSLDRGVETQETSIEGTWTAHLLEALVRIDHKAKDAAGGQEQAGTSAGTNQPIAAPASAPEPRPATQELGPRALAPSGPPAPEKPADEWIGGLKALGGVKKVVIVRTDGLAQQHPGADQDEEAAALTAFIGNAAKGIGKTLNFGPLQRAEVQIGGVPRLVLANGETYAGLELGTENNPHHVALEAQRILKAREAK